MKSPLLPSVSFALLAPAANALVSIHEAQRLIPHEVVVGVAPGADPLALEAYGATLLETADGDAFARLEFPATTSGVQRMQALAAMDLDPGTTFAEFQRTLSSPEQDYCLNGGTPATQSCTIAFFDGTPDAAEYGSQPALSAIDVQAVWNLLGPQTCTVAVIDTGVDPTHQVLAGRLHGPGWDFIAGAPHAVDVANGLDDDGDGLVDEAYGHGTHVAGTIALINPGALILPLRVLDSDGNGTAWNVARAIRHAVDAGADFINLSLGMVGHSAVVAAALDYAHEADVEIYASAGNTGMQHVLFPGSDSHTISVAATDEFDVKAPFSAWGEDVDLCAPGVDIYGAMPGDQFAWWSGCSFATAIACGAGSLLRCVTTEDPEEVTDALEDAATDIDAVNPGYVDLLGEGRIDVVDALNYILTE